MPPTWTKDVSRARIEAAIKELDAITIMDFTKDLVLEKIPLNQAYRIQAVHVYVDVLNSASLLETNQTETETSHRKVLRFFHLYQRVAHLIFSSTDAKKIDLQNQRLHFIIFKPYDNAVDRINRAIAIADLFWRLIGQGSKLHEELPDLKLAIGIESGSALAVNNGTRGDREPLFIGTPANQAAKLLGPDQGIFLGSNARANLGANWIVQDPKLLPLTADEVSLASEDAKLTVSLEALAARWANELKETPLAEFAFSRQKPPLRDLPLDQLTPANSRRSELASIHADVDGFTNYVKHATDGGKEAQAVRALHVIRKEMRDLLTDFGGRKLRYVGDCLHGVLAEGSASTTDTALTVTSAVLYAAALRDAFKIIQEKLPDTSVLGLQVGIDFGPVSITRIGIRNGPDRCAVGQAVLTSEEEQCKCTGKDTALGGFAYSLATESIRALFSSARRAPNLTFNQVVEALKADNDQTIKAITFAPPTPTATPARAHIG